MNRYLILGLTYAAIALWTACDDGGGGDGDVEADGDSDLDADVDGDSDQAGDGDIDTATSADAEVDRDAEATSDADSASEADGDTDSDGDAGIDADSDLDVDAEGDSDVAGGCDRGTPADCCAHSEMILIDTLGACIDRFEASAGSGGRARSVREAMPWALVTWDGARAACQAAGKRLCRDEEWAAACGGPEGLRYPYGAFYEDRTCNGQDRGEGVALPAGSLPGCEGGYPGLFDMSGNVWEWIDLCDGESCTVRGGSFYDIFGTLLQCTTARERGRSTEVPNIGFRCCLSISEI
jgi:hypothetical protein